MPIFSLVGPTAFSAPGYPFRPASPGETIQMFAFGLGLPQNAIIDGSASQAGQLPAPPLCQIGRPERNRRLCRRHRSGAIPTQCGCAGHGNERRQPDHLYSKRRGFACRGFDRGAVVLKAMRNLRNGNLREFTISCCSLSAGLAAAQTPTPVTLVNPGFEAPYNTVNLNGGTITGQVANGWSDNSSYDNATVQYSQETTNPHGGASCQKIVVANATMALPRISSSAPATSIRRRCGCAAFRARSGACWCNRALRPSPRTSSNMMWP